MNEKIIEQFKLLIKQIKFDIDNTSGKEQIKHTFRLSSIEKAFKILEDFKEEIKNIKQLEDVVGIGKGTIERIDEILKTGKLSEVKIMDTTYLKGLDELSKVYGIGRKRAINLMKKYNVAILGIRGAVGQCMYRIVKERKFPVNKLILISPSGAGGELDGIKYVPLTKEVFNGVDIVLSSPGAEISKIWAPI